MARRFVQAHHVQPLSELGPDIGENVVVLCPNCHTRLHAGAMRAERTDQGIRIVEVQTGYPVHRGEDASSQPEGQQGRAFHQRMVDWFRDLDTQRQDLVLRELIAIAASSNGRAVND